MNNDLQRELLGFVKEKRLSPLGLAALLVLEALILLPYFWTNFGTGLTLLEYIILAFIFTVSILVWFLSRRYPSNPKGKIGIVVAVVTENKADYIKLRSDLIDGLHSIINNKYKQDIFNVIPLNEYLASKVKDRETSHEALEKTKSHLVIYGICKRRLDNGEKYFLQLEAVVRHRAIPLAKSDQLSQEFAKLFPRRVAFPVTQELIGFEVAREWLHLATKYMLGVAAFLSYDFEFAFELFKELQQELKHIDVNIEQLKKLRSYIPKRISETSVVLAAKKYFQYRKTKERQHLENAKIYLDILQNLDPNNYEAHLLRGIYLFVINKDVESAKKEIRKSKNNMDSTWRYSEAFLYAYDGDLDKAERSYKKAFKSEVLPDIIFQTEEFIHDVLGLEPEKCQLWYGLGMINWKAKGDLILAKQAFEKFLECGDEQLYREQKQKVDQYITQINHEINQSKN